MGNIATYYKEILDVHACIQAHFVIQQTQRQSAELETDGPHVWQTKSLCCPNTFDSLIIHSASQDIGLGMCREIFPSSLIVKV